MPHHVSRITLERHSIWWTWTIVAVADDGSSPLVIARGANLTQRKAQAAIASWQRVYLRRLGKY